MKVTKEEVFGYTGSAIVCLLLLLLLSVIVLRTEVLQAEEGILVNFGNVDLAAGTFEPRSQQADIPEIASEASSPAVQPQTNEPVLTQDTEESVAIAAAEKARKEQEARIAQEKQRQLEEQRRREAINQQVAGAFNNASSATANQGTAASGVGNQGSPQGSPDSNVYADGSGYGEFSLTGRTLGSGGLPKPAYSVQDEGKIVVNITVDPKGNVILAEIGKGTNIDNASLRKSALEAARKTKFNAISGSNNQSGTITYKYKLN
ncbi:MAG: TonB family protein [Dysgonamonadaceae bacterium]|jgi:TonB family protein|nr:TonB family protein [Dysgonamonadaceae bacterium]